jgi:DNA-directed RNA polymerase sigma subunit (sigma70/sigma32)
MSIWQAERTLDDVEARIDIERALKKLHPRTAAVLKERTGFSGQPIATLAALGRVLRLSGAGVRCIEVSGLSRLRRGQWAKSYFEIK